MCCPPHSVGTNLAPCSLSFLPPGNPSGHVMVTLAVLLACARHLNTSSSVKLLISVSIATLVTLVALSRIIISTHFIHQVLFGVLVGLLVHHSSTHHLHLLHLHPSNAAHFILVAVTLFLLAIGEYYTLIWLGLDPEFSVPKAIRYWGAPVINA